MQEKFRSFSGRIDLVVEIRASSDRVETLDVEINLMVDAVVRTLDQNRGDWGSGVVFGGVYEVAFGPVKQGGKNYLQTAKVTFSVEVSRA
jgi:hypothetical protein